ncbi:LOW QUALITY PROTEIN: hypothetical protein V2J09_020448 [Rumex salicifolius]
MADTIISEFAKLVLGQLSSLIVHEVKLSLGLEHELDRMKSNLSTIQVVLRDAQRLQATSDSIKNWLGKLHDVMYDIDDLLDDVATEVTIQDKNSGECVGRFFSHDNSLVLRLKWSHHIKNLRSKLDRIALERDRFVLSTEFSPQDEFESELRETYSKVNKLDILGRGRDKKAIIDSILDSQSTNPYPKYGHMPKHVAFVHETAFLRGAKGHDLRGFGRQELRELIDVGAKGSVVIVTTRDSKVASIVKSDALDEYRLNELSYKASLQIFKKLAFNNGEDIKPSLLSFAKEIVQKSRGLSLPVTTLGNLLHGKTDEREWLCVIHKLEQGYEDVLNILKLSYNRFPPNLKLYFRICSVYDKGFELIPALDLLPLWMALGFLPCDDQGDKLGRKCIEELLSKSIFMKEDIDFEDDMFSSFHMHDLVYDLAKSIAADELMTINCSTKEIPEKIRYLKIR